MKVSSAPLDPPPAPAFANLVEARVSSGRLEGVSYRVIQHADGSWECGCQGFTYGARADRLCKHIDEVRRGIEYAASFLALLEQIA